MASGIYSMCHVWYKDGGTENWQRPLSSSDPTCSLYKEIICCPKKFNGVVKPLSDNAGVKTQVF